MRPRVVMVVGAYYPELAGGSLQCRTLVNSLLDRVDVSVLATSASASLPAHAQIDGVSVTRVIVDAARVGSKLAAAPHLLHQARRVFADRDVVHFHGITEKLVPLLALSKLSGRRTVGKLTSVGWDDPVALGHRRFGRLLTAAVRRLDRVVAVSPAMRDRCRAAGLPDEQIAVIPNGVDTGRFAPADPDERRHLRQTLGLPPDVVLVTFVGFWSLEKGPHVLFDAWRAARARTNADTALLFIGTTDAGHAEVDAAMVRRVRAEIEEQGLAGRVFFVERTTDVPAYLRASDVFALPSSREGLPNALLEAMACGLPALAAQIDGVTDYVIRDGENGLLVRAGDARDLCDALAPLLLDAGRRRQMGDAARQTAIGRFAIGSVADRYVDLYSQLLGRA